MVSKIASCDTFSWSCRFSVNFEKSRKIQIFNKKLGLREDLSLEIIQKWRKLLRSLDKTLGKVSKFGNRFFVSQLQNPFKGGSNWRRKRIANLFNRKSFFYCWEKFRNNVIPFPSRVFSVLRVPGKMGSDKALLRIPSWAEA